MSRADEYNARRSRNGWYARQLAHNLEKASAMGKRLTAIATVAALLGAYALAEDKSPATATSKPTSQPTSRCAELAAKLIPMIQDITKIDAPGADGFASALAGVLKKYSLPVPDELLKGKPSAALPKLTEEQIKSWSSQTTSNLLDCISYTGTITAGPEEGALRLDLLEAVCRHAPSISLRLQAAGRLLRMATPYGEENRRSAMIVEAHRAIEAAKAAVTESLAAANDGRDTFSMKTGVGRQLALVSTAMLMTDLVNLKEPTPDSLEKARKEWGAQFAAFEQGTEDDASKDVLSHIIKSCQEPLKDEAVQALLLPGQCKVVMEAYFKALNKRDKDALIPLLTPTTAFKYADKDMNAVIKDIVDGVPREIRLLLLRGPYTTSAGETFVSCNLVWIDEDGKEHGWNPEIHVVKTDKGVLVGEK